jgi:hypothetical protein
MESSRDDIGSDDQKEEIPQQEIDISTTNFQVSTKPALGSLVLADTLPIDGKQMEVKPS